ncbi:MAG TPA: DUF1573 domain-containing protein, partial [Patescibacteria group bacterium]|nr:DUF1573 domain-containing protein [Patescibacteria group bacterium]
MKRFLTFAFAALCTLTTAYAQPKLEVLGGDTYDWGKVKPADSPLKTTLKIKNSGNQQLKISDVKVGCGCTTTGIAKKELSPGETTTMDVSLNTGATSGAMTKSVTINSNDPLSPSKLVLLKAEVVRAIQVLPSQYITFNDLKPGSESTTKITIRNTSPNDITLSDVSTTNDLRHNLKSKTVVKANSNLDVIVKVKIKEKGYYNALLKMKTSHPDFPLLEIPAYGNALDASSPVYMN